MKNGHGRGRLIDFHVHTPVSRCYSEDGVQPRHIVEAALAARLDAVVICDHHSPAAIDAVRRAAAATPLVVFPAMEITTAQGHLLAIFDPAACCATLERLLDDLDIPARHRGNGSHVIGPPLETVIDAVAAAGGLPIPAHIDRWPNGFLEAPSDFRTRRRIHGHAAVPAVEITLPSTQEGWQSGSMPGYARPIACVQGSDAHAVAEVGRRPTRVRTEALSVAGLRAALTVVTGVTELLPW